MAKTKPFSDSINLTYRYSRPAVLLPNLISIPAMIFGIWIIITRNILWVRILLISGVLLFLGLAIRPALRLGDTLRLDSLGITKESPFGSIHIPWQNVVRVEPYTSPLERACFRIVSVTGERITFSEFLIGYEELCARIYHLVLAIKGDPQQMTED
jgi:hypothetical protein